MSALSNATRHNACPCCRVLTPMGGRYEICEQCAKPLNLPDPPPESKAA